MIVAWCPFILVCPTKLQLHLLFQKVQSRSGTMFEGHITHAVKVTRGFINLETFLTLALYYDGGGVRIGRQFCGKFSSPKTPKPSVSFFLPQSLSSAKLWSKLAGGGNGNGNRDGIAQKKFASFDQMSYRRMAVPSILSAESGIKFVGCGCGGCFLVQSTQY